MISELFGRLFKIANDFQLEILKRLSFSTQRLVEENIIIKNDYSEIFNACNSKEAHNMEMQ